MAHDEAGRRRQLWKSGSSSLEFSLDPLPQMSSHAAFD
jgi:hypothetical protein